MYNPNINEHLAAEMSAIYGPLAARVSAIYRPLADIVSPINVPLAARDLAIMDPS